ncbi:NUDIX hydrolase [Vibrio maerlii]|uniref:NUDIX hydrolase n=1 Tax=Vibrio maerlii TaxID=2231648 RepID=UPI000E3D0010|nr:NUDIX hydrolase [Vibrio maerlii]
MSKIIHQWKRISLNEDQVTLPTGQTITHTTIHHPGAAVILPILEDGRLVLVRQFRPSLNKWILELPAGTIEENELPLACAKRELKEETGYECEKFIDLGQLTPLAGFCDEIQHLFIATDVKQVCGLNCDDDEIIEIQLLTVDELENLIKTNQISDTKTIACLSKAKLCGYI